MIERKGGERSSGERDDTPDIARHLMVGWASFVILPSFVFVGAQRSKVALEIGKTWARGNETIAMRCVATEGL